MKLRVLVPKVRWEVIVTGLLVVFQMISLYLMTR